jgi:demethylmenaquinone methyltransferase / 2-methoxy-6-polyprenyl-1,4-benzoquinol methylase
MQERMMSIKPHELPFVREMFNHIAPRYDFLNRLLSLRRDVHWRRILVAGLALNDAAHVLDVACGTGDVALEIIRRKGPGVRVTGVDFAPEMLRLALPKISTAAITGAIRLVAADAFDLPFGTARFDAVTMAFGIRNIQDKTRALEILLSHLKPGGQLAILELGMPSRGLPGWAYRLYFKRLLPLVGRLFSKHGFAYTYLPASVAGFPPSREFAALMGSVGFKSVRYRELTMGVAVIFTGRKPSIQAEPA